MTAAACPIAHGLQAERRRADGLELIFLSRLHSIVEKNFLQFQRVRRVGRIHQKRVPAQIRDGFGSRLRDDLVF